MTQDKEIINETINYFEEELKQLVEKKEDKINKNIISDIQQNIDKIKYRLFLLRNVK